MASRFLFGENMKYLNLEQIRTDGGTQTRTAISQEVISEYAEAMSEGDEFPAVVVFHDGNDYWLADGFHRVAACRAARIDEVSADVQSGTLRDALLFAAGANSQHGFRRTNADKRMAVRRLLEDKEWSGWNDSEIARRCRVSHPMVAHMRKGYLETFQDKSVAPTPRKVERNGTVYEMNTSRIGTAAPRTEKIERPDLMLVDSKTGEIVHDPMSPNDRASYSRRADFGQELIDHLEFLANLNPSEVCAKVLPEDREDVDRLLSTAAAHIREIHSIWRNGHVTREERIERADRQVNRPLNPH